MRGKYSAPCPAWRKALKYMSYNTGEDFPPDVLFGKLRVEMRLSG